MLKICTPYYERIEPECMDSIEALKAAMGKKATWMNVRGTLVADSRNTLVNGGHAYEAIQKIRGDIEGFLFVDSDIAFTVEQAERLLGRGKQIISGMYKSRHSTVMDMDDEEYTCGWMDGNIAAGERYWKVLTQKKYAETAEPLLKVDWCGAGFLYVAKEVFEKVEYPWFYHRIIETEVDGKKMRVSTGEDVGFCIAAREAGFEIFVDTHCHVRHLVPGRFLMDELPDINPQNKEIILLGQIESCKNSIYKAGAAARVAKAMADKRGLDQARSQIEKVVRMKDMYEAMLQAVRDGRPEDIPAEMAEEPTEA